MIYKKVLTKLSNKEDLTKLEIEQFLQAFFKEEVTSVQMSAFLTALTLKGETTFEMLGCIEAMRSQMTTIAHDRMVIDTCGTGGDGKGTFNISTATALLAAACGAKVAKHGNRAASSQCGSADVLEALGMNIMLSPAQAETMLEKTGMVFLFAPTYHPALKPVSIIRRELGFRTIFNYLGPFLNPALVRRQLIGVPDTTTAQMLAEVASHLKYDILYIICNDQGIDEITLEGKSKVYEVIGSTVRTFHINPEKLGMVPVPDRDLKGGDIATNAQIIKDIFAGKSGPHREVVIINTAYALLVANHVQTPKQGVELARDILDNGYANEFLQICIKTSNTV